MDNLNTWYFSTDQKNWTSVTLPHTAYIEPEVITQPQIGTVYYRYAFTAPEEWQKKVVYFEIGAAMQKAEIKLNGVYHFTHFGGYQKFFIPLTDDLQYGKINELEICLENAPLRDMPPGKDVLGLDFCYHSGLYREAVLRVWEPVHITDPLAVSIPAGGGIFIRTEQLNGNDAVISASCHVMHEFPATRRFELLQYCNTSNAVSLNLQILDPDGNIVFQQTSDSIEIKPNCDHTFVFNNISIPQAALWTPDTPCRYQACFQVFCNGKTVHTQAEKFGIRIQEFRRDGFYLNGEKIFLAGTNRHMEYPFVGNALSANAQRRDAMLIKRGGYNMVRLSHYNQDPAFLEACDEIGLFVMPAIPGWQAYHSNSSFIENAFRDCRELIRSLRNRPSVILWEVSLNEAYPPTWINREFHRIAHEEYPGPHCYSAGDTWGFFEGWDVLFPCEHLRSGHKPLFMREYGDWSFGGQNSTSRRSRGDSKADLFVQAWNFLWTYNNCKSIPGMTGCADWCFIDYNRGYAPDIEQSGSLDVYRLPKPKFYFYQSQMDPEKMPVLYAVHDELSKLLIFSNGDEVEIRKNGNLLLTRKPDNGPDTPYGKKASPNYETAVLSGNDTSVDEYFNGGNVSKLAHPPFTIKDFPPVREGEEYHILARHNGKVIAETFLRKPGKVESVHTQLRTEGIEIQVNDLIFVDAILQDAQGNIPELSLPVHLNVSGDAEVIGGMSRTVAGIASWLVRIKGSNYQLKAELSGEITAN